MAKAQRKRRRGAMEVGSGNVFADLGLPDAEELKTKVQLAMAIKREVDFSVERLSRGSCLGRR
jgi:hypothetical protein